MPPSICILTTIIRTQKGGFRRAAHGSARASVVARSDLVRIADEDAGGET
jgi:hypothetical protein